MSGSRDRAGTAANWRRGNRKAWGVIVLRWAGLAAPLLLVAPSTHAQTVKKDAVKPKPLSQSLTGTAKADFDAAKLLANDRDFVGALIKFQNAYDASKDPRILWNVAFCQKNLRHYAKVVITLKRYIAEGGALLSAGDKNDAQELIATIEPFTTRANLRVNQDGAQVVVDDEPVGTSPLASALVLDIGERRLRVTKDGFRPYEKALIVGGGAEMTVDVALEKEVHEGKLIVDAPPGATIFVDDKQVAVGKAEQSVASGGHQLRVTAPGMRPYQTEIIVQDRETRSLNVVLEPVAQGEKPNLRVAVGCADTDPKGPEDGLVINVDGPEVLPPGPVKKRTDDSGKNVVEQVEYPIAPGPHTIRVRIADCRAADQAIDVDPVKGADVSGALESSKFILFRGPQGSPGWFRASIGLWMAAGDARQSAPEQYSTQGLGVAGVALDVGIIDRWFGLYVNGAYGSGSFNRSTYGTHYSLPSSASATWEELRLRFGPRFPFHLVAIGFGPMVGVQELDLDQVRTGKPAAIFGAFAEIDVQPLCDWGVFALGSAEKSSDEDNGSGGLQVGVFWEPNARCRRERATTFGLKPKGM
jgi:hypothetical protein